MKDYECIKGTMPGFKENGMCEQIIDLENRKVTRYYESGTVEQFDIEVNNEQ